MLSNAPEHLPNARYGKEQLGFFRGRDGRRSDEKFSLIARIKDSMHSEMDRTSL